MTEGTGARRGTHRGKKKVGSKKSRVKKAKGKKIGESVKYHLIKQMAGLGQPTKGGKRGLFLGFSAGPAILAARKS